MHFPGFFCHHILQKSNSWKCSGRCHANRYGIGFGWGEELKLLHCNKTVGGIWLHLTYSISRKQEYCVSFTSTLKTYIVYAAEAEEEHKPLKPVHSRPLPSCKLLYTCSWLFTLNCTVTFRQQESSLLGYILGALCLRQIANVLFQFCSSGVFQNISFRLQTVKEVNKSKTFLICSKQVCFRNNFKHTSRNNTRSRINKYN